MSLRKLLRLTKPSINYKQYSTGVKDGQEIRIPVPWGHLAGKWWGPTDKRPILTIHGWQDNCGTWNRMLPLLKKDVGFLTIDLPGHGLSSKLPHGLYNHGIFLVIILRYLKGYFGWEKTSFMGHSLGGIITYIYGMLYPKDVDFAICLDASKPLVNPGNNIQIAQKMDAFLKYSLYEMNPGEPPSYTIEDIIKKTCEPNNKSIQVEHAHHIYERNIAPSKENPGKYYFTRDVRLKSGGLMNFPQHEILESTENMKFPIFIAKATGAPYYEPKENFYENLEVLRKSSKDCEYRYVDGKHHFHLNNPELISDALNDFINRHDVEDRSNGGIKKGMLLEERLKSQN